MRNRTYLFLLLVLPLVIGCGSKPSATALSSSSTPISNAAQVQVLSGKVQVNQPGAPGSKSYTSATTLEIGGFIQVLENGKAKLILPDGSALLAGAMTDLELVSMQPGKAGTPNKLATRFRMDAGVVSIVLAGDSIEVETPAGTARVSGSIMTMVSNPNGATRVVCLEGACTLENASGSLTIQPGQSGVISGSSSAPVLAGEEDWSDPNAPDYEVIIPANTLAALEAVKTQAAQTQTARLTPSPTPRPKN